MKSDFLLAITQLSAEKNLPREVVLTAVETALVSAYRKDNFAPNQNISVKINPSNGNVQVWAEKVVVEHPEDARSEISLAEAQRIEPNAHLGENVIVEATPHNAGRIAAQTAKQVILQRLHEAEHSAIFEEYADKEGDIITGVVQRLEPRQIFVDLGRTEAILPAAEQVPNERYRIGQRLKVVILEVVRTSRGPRVIVSRSHPDLPRRLFEMEVPEILHGTVALQSIAREAGSRSKVAVAALQEGVDPVGCCVGLRGIRIQSIVSELSGEKIDVIMWSPQPSVFIANALSPAQILKVELDEAEKVATVVVPDRQLSLAIGKEGQNVRLAVKLTGWRIDIKSASAAEAQRVEAERAVAERAEAARVADIPLALAEESAEKVVEEPEAEEDIAIEMPALEPTLAAAEAKEPAEALPSLDIAFVASPVSRDKSTAVGRPGLRFAEDILGAGPPKSQTKSKKKKKSSSGRETEEDGAGGRRPYREQEFSQDDDEEY